MKILLILPHDRTYRYGGFFRRSVAYAPLTLTTLAALVPPELQASVAIVDEGVQKPDYEREHYDVVGITSVTATAPRAYELAGFFRRRGSLVVMGGIHASLIPEEAIAHADVVVTGLAERTWPQLLRDFAARRPLQRIYSDTIRGSLGGPVPRRDLLPPRTYLPFPTLIASRGCPNHCSFCSVHPLCRSQIVPRPVDEVVEEIRNLRRNTLILLDPNIAGNRSYAKSLLQAMIPLRIRWASSATMDFVEDQELFDLFVRSGCLGLLIGLDSVSQESMTGCGKQVNNVAHYTDAVRRCRTHGIAVLCCFILGFDEDTEAIFDETIAFMDEAKPDLVRCGVLTPYPGTSLFARYKKENRILTEDWSRYDTQHVVFEPRQMSAVALQDGLRKVWDAAYTSRRIFDRVLSAGSLWRLSLASNLGFRYYARRAAREFRNDPVPCASTAKTHECEDLVGASDDTVETS